MRRPAGGASAGVKTLAVVLAAGRGARLGRLTSERSKAMMPIAGKPMITRILDMLESGGIEHFIVVVHPEDRELVAHLSESPRASRVRLAYQAQRLGMADAAASAAPLVRSEHTSDFVLASCDNLFPKGHVRRLIERRRGEKLDAVLTVTKATAQEAQSSAIVLMKNSKVADIIEKPDSGEIARFGTCSEVLIAPSLYALSSTALDYLPEVTFSSRGEREFTDALRLLIADGKQVTGMLVEERMTLTQPKDLLAINRHFLRRNPGSSVVGNEVPVDAHIVPPVLVEAGAQVGAGCEIGPEVYLESGSAIGQSTTIRRTVVLRGASVEANRLVDQSVIL